LYKLQPLRYKQLHDIRKLQQLMQLQVQSLPGLTETLQLGSAVKQQQAVAALQEHKPPKGSGSSSSSSSYVMLINNGSRDFDLRCSIADQYAALLCGEEAVQQQLSSRLRQMLKQAQHGQLEEAREELLYEKVPEIPADLRPWQGEGQGGSNSSSSSAVVRRSVSRKSAWEESDDEEDAVDTAASLSASGGLQAGAAAAAVDAGVLDSSWQWPQSNTAGSSNSSAGGASNSKQHSAQQGTDAAAWQPQAWNSTELHNSGAMLSQFGSLSLTEPRPTAAATTVASAAVSDTLRQQIKRMQLAAADAASSTALQLPLAAANAAGAAAMDAGLAGGSFMQFIRTPPALGAAPAASASNVAGAPAAASVASLNNESAAGNFPALQVSSATATQHSSSAAATAPSSSSTAVSFTASREVTHTVTATTTTTRDTLTMHAAPAASGSSSSSSRALNNAVAAATQHSSSSSSCGSIDQLEFHEVVGVLGEAFLFSLLQQKLPGFDESCWHSSLRKYWAGSESPLPPPATEPSYDFLYTDVEGELSGTCGTLCFIECKATSYDAAASGSGVSTHAWPITCKEWELARLVKRQSTQQQPAMYIVMCVDRVGQVGGPRLAAVLPDPVGMLQDGKLWITGQELALCDFPLRS
jgi:hypothetical protein